MQPMAIMPNMALWATKRSVLSPWLQKKKKFDQIGHAVFELSSIEKLLTGVLGRRPSPFSKIIFLNIFGWTRKVLSQLDQRNLVFSNQINGNWSRAYLNSRKTTFRLARFHLPTTRSVRDFFFVFGSCVRAWQHFGMRLVKTQIFES